MRLKYNRKDITPLQVQLDLINAIQKDKDWKKFVVPKATNEKRQMTDRQKESSYDKQSWVKSMIGTPSPCGHSLFKRENVVYW